MAFYSRFTRRQAGVIYRAAKEGRVDVERPFMNAIYAQADVSVEWNNAVDDIEARLRAAVDALMNGDDASAQDALDAARVRWAALHGIDAEAA